MPDAPLTRASLLLRIRDANDVEAWQRFLELYGPFVHGWYRKRGLQDADASDLTQEVLHAVSSGADRFDYDPERGTFRSWLFTIARRRLNDFVERRRREARRLGTAVTLDFLPDESTSEEEARWERDYQRRLFGLAAESVRSRVDDSTWRAFWMTAVEGQPGKVVADELQLSLGSVYVAKSRVLAHLKQRIRQIQGDER